MRFPISVWSGYYIDQRPDKAMDLFMNAGFTHMEWAFRHTRKMLEQGSPEKMGQQVAIWAKERDFSIPQGHLSFKGGLCDDDRLEQVKKEVDFFLNAGITNAVLHANGGDDLPHEERYDRWVKNITALCQQVKGTNLTLCLENLGSVPYTHWASNLMKLIDDCGGENLGICLDVGHLHMTNIRDGEEQSSTEFIRTVGKRLKALHIHENNGKADDHQLPFSAKKAFDWKQLIRALEENGYQGLFNMELPGEANNAPLEVRHEKLKYIRFLCEYMLSDEFLNS
jgi:sugar phosphate isomerase/epimerase